MQAQAQVVAQGQSLVGSWGGTCPAGELWAFPGDSVG